MCSQSIIAYRMPMLIFIIYFLCHLSSLSSEQCGIVYELKDLKGRKLPFSLPFLSVNQGLKLIH